MSIYTIPFSFSFPIHFKLQSPRHNFGAHSASGGRGRDRSQTESCCWDLFHPPPSHSLRVAPFPLPPCASTWVFPLPFPGPPPPSSSRSLPFFPHYLPLLPCWTAFPVPISILFLAALFFMGVSFPLSFRHVLVANLLTFSYGWNVAFGPSKENDHMVLKVRVGFYVKMLRC